ncbi:hypothetical protein PsYK624_123610 [Phanerochaete sordida]|uniref:Uncharacterized protein n=1 Tax=Phanerochaete sordida TaxID=48140 RepID=A0A9P3GHQ0_9APHY|nr:hypothetical protein PsYK624_123610 [Phanerochaete sordida]
MMPRSSCDRIKKLSPSRGVCGGNPIRRGITREKEWEAQSVADATQMHRGSAIGPSIMGVTDTTMQRDFMSAKHAKRVEVE